MLDVYSSPPWEVLCVEVSKLRVRLLEGQIVALPVAVGAVVVQSAEAADITDEIKRPLRDSNPCYLRERRVS